MLEQLTAYFIAAHRIRRSERHLVRAAAAMELEELQSRIGHPRFRARIADALNHYTAAKAQAS